MIKVFGSSIKIVTNSGTIIRTFDKIVEFIFYENNELSFVNSWTGESEEYYLNALESIEIQFYGNAVFVYVKS